MMGSKERRDGDMDADAARRHRKRLREYLRGADVELQAHQAVPPAHADPAQPDRARDEWDEEDRRADLPARGAGGR
jgi:hypothetical protein